MEENKNEVVEETVVAEETSVVENVEVPVEEVAAPVVEVEAVEEVAAPVVEVVEPVAEEVVETAETPVVEEVAAPAVETPVEAVETVAAETAVVEEKKEEVAPTEAVKEEVKVEEKPKKKGKGILVILLVLVLLCGLGAGGYYFLMNKDNTEESKPVGSKNNNSHIVEENQTEKKDESKVDDSSKTNDGQNLDDAAILADFVDLVPDAPQSNVSEEVKKELSEKVNILLDFYNEKNISDVGEITYLVNVFSDIVFDEKIDSWSKANLVLKSMPKESVTISSDNVKCDDSSNDMYVKQMIKEAKQVSMQKAKEIYKDLFGEELEIKKVGKCPGFYPDSTNGVYYALGGCGGTGDGTRYYYKNKYEKNGNEAYVYVNLVDVYPGTSYIFSDKEVNKSLSYVYNTITSTNGLEPVYSFPTSKKFYINNSNMDKFSNYKFTFKLNGNRYNFVKAEKVK